MKTIEAKAKEYAEKKAVNYFEGECLMNGFLDGYTACLSDTGEEVKRYKEVIQAQRNYISFLGDEIINMAGYLHAHGQKPSTETIKEGELLREELRIANEALNPKL